MDVALLAACAAPRIVEARKNKRPMLRDLRQATAADSIMFVYRDCYYNPRNERTDASEIIVARQRLGPTGTVELAFDAKVGRFRDMVYREFSL